MRRMRQYARRTHWITARKVSIVLAGLLVLVTVIGSQAQHGAFELKQAFVDMWGNWSAELAGIVVTVLVIDTLNQRRAIVGEKNDLILQMGSPDNAFALEAVRRLRARGWLTDGSLHRARLENANLQGADLSHADLQGAYLVRANLQGARLYEANLSRAVLNDADLSGALLTRADLHETHLTDTQFHSADLSGACMWKAMIVAHHDRKLFDEQTILPDQSHWSGSPETIKRFTDPAHPQFWRSGEMRSPAYNRRDA